MDEIPEAFDLRNVEQLRTIADPLRIRIFEALVTRPMTATQVGEELNIAAPKAHYHVRELERIGLVKLVETRERSGILEKYYRAVARNLRAPAELLQTSEPSEVAAAISAMFANLSQSFATTLNKVSGSGPDAFEQYMLLLESSTVWMTPAEFKQVSKQVEALYEAYRTRRDVPGEREAQVTLISYDVQSAASAEGESAKVASSAQNGEAPRVRPVFVVGLTNYSRKELEQVVAAGQQLDLNVSGYLSFGSDVTADLVDRAIARLTYRGVLNAPADVRAVLRRKEH